MNRIGLLIAVACALVVGVTFAVRPELDLLLIAPFYSRNSDFWLGLGPSAQFVRDMAQWAVVLVAAPAVVAVGLKLARPRWPLLLPGRAVVLLISTLALGPGLLTNVVLKDHWGRPRPIDVTEFNGQDRFVPWWDPRGTCPKNCSFIAGEPSGAFWTIAAAAVAPPAWRALGYSAALAFGLGVGFLRITAGAHFFTDVVFAGVFTFFLIWIAHGLLYRWCGNRFTDARVEHAIERAAASMRSGLRRLIGRPFRARPFDLPDAARAAPPAAADEARTRTAGSQPKTGTASPAPRIS